MYLRKPGKVIKCRVLNEEGKAALEGKFLN
jgi:hypothetical protein